jgi:hypothetical protein
MGTMPTVHEYDTKKLVAAMEASLKGSVIELGQYATTERIESKLKLFYAFWKHTEISGFSYYPEEKIIRIWSD